MRDGRILIVDDDSLIRDSLRETLKLEGYRVEVAASGVEAQEKTESFPADIVITDMRMPEMSGLDLLRWMKQKHPGSAVLLVTGYGSIENAVEAMKEGASDYITKPIMDNEIKVIIQRILEHKRLAEENKSLREQIASLSQFHELVGHDGQMQQIYSMIDTIAGTDASVLIRGESGTGKRLIARAIHYHDPARRDHPFVELSCGALPENLLESELFGHVKGAFTGAFTDRIGRFELADKGTILLDDIDAFTPGLQVKLLRVLQEQEFERVGDTKTIKVDVRIIASTNQELEGLMEDGGFRKDLYYRLNVVCIRVPPLRDRPGDVPVLAQHFLDRCSSQIGREKQLSEETLRVLSNYKWPGNVRELENAIERAAIISRGPVITPDDLPETLRKKARTQKMELPGSLREAMKNPERQVILEALRMANWNRKEAADLLGISRSTLYNKMRDCGIELKKMSKSGT